MSACRGFSTCRIQFIPTDKQRAERTYSDRSLIELRQHDFANFTLRALDIVNNKAEIFKIPLQKEDQYKRGKSVTFPDEIRDSAGTYCLWLNAASRIQFHDALNAAIEEIRLSDPGTPQASTPPPNVITKTNPQHDDEQPKRNSQQNYEQSNLYPRIDHEEPKTNPRQAYEQPKTNPRQAYEQPKSYPQHDDEQPKTNPRQASEQPKSYPQHNDEQPRTNPRQDYEQPKPIRQSNRHDILANVYQLGQHIRQGNTDDAVNLAKKLSENRVRLQSNLETQHNEEKPIPIRVKIDSNDTRISRQHDKDLQMNVYPSTSVRELRTAFEYSDDFPPSNQYFFVNGHLAHENSTMIELDVHPNSLFVLFVIQQ